MKIRSVKINNILSIEDAYVEFDDNGLMLVQGWNHDVGRANGAGKTAIFNAIAFALYDNLPRKITATEIVRRGAKSGYVEVCVEWNEGRFLVQRSRPRGFVVYDTTGDTGAGLDPRKPITITQAELESKLGLNYNQFMITMYCSQGAQSRFLSTNDSGKKQFLLQLLNLEEFSLCKSLADKKAKSLIDESVQLQAKMDAIDSKMDAHAESLVDENSVQFAINEGNKFIADQTKEMIQLQGVPAPDLSKYQRLEEDLVNKITEIAKAKVKRELLHDQYRKINAHVKPFDGLSSCLACGARLDNAAAEAAHSREIDSKKQELSSIKTKIDECEVAISQESKVNEYYSKLKNKKKEDSRAYEIASVKINEIQRNIALKSQQLDQLNLKLENNSDLLSKIKGLSDIRAKIANNRANILREIEIYETVSAMYSPTGAQAYILDSVIESFNERAQQYVNILWSNLTYELKSYKENVKGEVTAKFSEHVTMDGKDISIGSMSGGEFRALSLCVDFALIDVLERQVGISMSPIILDEPFDGLDASGKDTIVELLESLSKDRQVVVVDHASELKSMFSKVISVDKKNGISEVSLAT